MKKFQSLINKVLNTLALNRLSFLCFFVKDRDCKIGLNGSGVDLISLIKDCLDHYKKGSADEAQSGVADVILSAIALSYSPTEIKKIVAEKVDELIPNN